MEKIGIRQPEFKALNGLLKSARKDKNRSILHNLLVEDGAIHVTNGRMLIRLNKGAGLEPEPLKLAAGVYEILKTDISSKHLPAILSVEKIEGETPKMGQLLNAPVKSEIKSFDLHFEGDAQSLSLAIVKLYRAFKHPFNYEFLSILSPLDHGFRVSLLNGTLPALKLESDAVTALIMPFTMD